VHYAVAGQALPDDGAVVTPTAVAVCTGACPCITSAEETCGCMQMYVYKYAYIDISLCYYLNTVRFESLLWHCFAACFGR
jgi:hypothetical protein